LRGEAGFEILMPHSRIMNLHLVLLHTILAAFAFSAVAADRLPKSLMTQRGKLLVSEDFAEPITPVKHPGFASGYGGWRFKSLDSGRTVGGCGRHAQGH
jgi:hypothetical protein